MPGAKVNIYVDLSWNDPMAVLLLHVIIDESLRSPVGICENQERKVCVCVSVYEIKRDCEAEKGYERGLKCQTLGAVIIKQMKNDEEN